MLHDLQQKFMQYLTSGNIGESLNNAIKQDGISTEARLQIYFNNVLANSANALAINFPYLKKLVGEEYFAKIAIEFVKLGDLSVNNLAMLGDGFSDFLLKFEKNEQYKFIPQFAEFEWQINKMQCIDVSPKYLTQESLTSILCENNEVKLKLGDNFIIFSSDYNLVYLLEILDAKAEVCIDNSIFNSKSNILISKYDKQVKTFLLKDVEFQAIYLIKQGLYLQDVIENLSSEQQAAEVLTSFLNYKILTNE